MQWFKLLNQIGRWAITNLCNTYFHKFSPFIDFNEILDFTWRFFFRKRKKIEPLFSHSPGRNVLDKAKLKKKEKKAEDKEGEEEEKEEEKEEEEKKKKKQKKKKNRTKYRQQDS